MRRSRPSSSSGILPLTGRSKAVVSTVTGAKLPRRKRLVWERRDTGSSRTGMVGLLDLNVLAYYIILLSDCQGKIIGNHMTSTLHPSALASSSVKDPGVYHHRNLRPALIVAAREALETVAPESISLKALAAQLGVSQPAPYRHFSSREALLAAVATDGFEQFTAALAEAGGEGLESERFERACVAYLRFGSRYPGLYRLMFASHLLKTATDPSLERASRTAFDQLLHQLE